MSESYFCPMPARYGVACIDPVASVQHLGDALATEEAMKLRKLKYLVYLDEELHLPFPGMPWYRFTLSPIGQGLPPEDPERARTSDMCIPIFPNEIHPTGRPPIRPTPQKFPFSDCYHWFGVGVEVRIRAKPDNGVFDATGAMKLSIDEQLAISFVWDEVCERRRALLSPKLHKEATAEGLAGDGGEQDDVSDAASRISSRNGSEAAELSEEELANLNIFGDPDETGEETPLIDFTLDLRSLDEGPLPSPLDMMADCDAIHAIITRAKQRRHAKSQVSNPANKACPIVPQKEDRSKRGLSPLRILRKWYTGSVAIFRRRAVHTIRPPYLPVWP